MSEKKNLRITILVDGHPVEEKKQFIISGEELLLYSMMSNLIKNAFEASPKAAEITISLEQADMAVIRIHNQGAVAEHIRNKFFEKYVTFGKRTGTGLGTYSARLIAETHDGTISLDTSDEKGTTLMVCLPK